MAHVWAEPAAAVMTGWYAGNTGESGGGGVAGEGGVAGGGGITGSGGATGGKRQLVWHTNLFGVEHELSFQAPLQRDSAQFDMEPPFGSSWGDVAQLT